MAEGIQQIEAYARSMMGEIAHNYQYADRVRRWALCIARQESYPHLDRLEAAALLHDIGLIHDRQSHAQIGAELATTFLRRNQLFPEHAITEIAEAIRDHNSLEKRGPLRDADILDQINFQISCYENLRTTTARQLGRPLKVFMEQFLIELEAQITADDAP
jgi:HD superfamily phosphodiesterase